MAPRRWCRNRIRSVGCLSASEFRRFPISVPAAWAPCVAGRHHRGRLLLVTSLGDAREVTRLPGRDPACPSGRADSGFYLPRNLSNLALRLRTSKTTTHDGSGQPPSIRPTAYSGQASIRPADYSGRTDGGEGVRLYSNININININDHCVRQRIKITRPSPPRYHPLISTTPAPAGHPDYCAPSASNPAAAWTAPH